MNQPLPTLEGTKRIPIFPLPVALFPGTMLPLHIFEERYKAMVRDCLAGEKIFGVTFVMGREGFPPPVGRVGCAAFIIATVPLEEGRMNILTTGLSRYHALEYFQDEPYLEGLVTFFDDQPITENLTEVAEAVRATFQRTIKAIRAMSREEDTFPDDLPEDPKALSFLVASLLQMSDEQKMTLLELTDTGERLDRLRRLLIPAVEKYELRAAVNELAKTNGHGPHGRLGRLDS
ncbi:MAG: LON peptidase substrate-binding domain-containing protein [Chloracidobacterium sp.]|uniref:LON peptidase substrate-binding domain-containing protein n=1 Tax=Chloracidobacterium validum TaxID=2821543 RepID=A0ABX8B8R5_9BACT|nr:LON peptidase substrate-binding domain-containing protein [Chloracidobacterium validum]QUW02837.1 LON peptidase substrate-binding domain-containing protein [Chloracidobacterium validum]